MCLFCVHNVLKAWNLRFWLWLHQTFYLSFFCRMMQGAEPNQSFLLLVFVLISVFASFHSCQLCCCVYRHSLPCRLRTGITECYVVSQTPSYHCVELTILLLCEAWADSPSVNHRPYPPSPRLVCAGHTSVFSISYGCSCCQCAKPLSYSQLC